MFKHIMKLTWNRRRSNGLLVVEVAAAFLVLFILLAFLVYRWDNFRAPLGFEYENVWQLSFSVSGEWQESDGTALQQVLGNLRALKPVEAAHVIDIPPFRNWNWRSSYGPAEATVSSWINSMSDGAPQALDVKLIEGRWFGAADHGQPYLAVVVNRRFAELAYGSAAEVLGANINNTPRDSQDAREYRVVGVFEDFRQRGEFFQLIPYVIRQFPHQDLQAPTRGAFVRVAAGTQAAFEEKVIETIKASAPQWDVTVTPWERTRQLHHRQVLTPIRIMGTVAGFLLLMVVLGLIGVLWQDVVRRTQELGLRRALGATAGSLRLQVVAEMIAVALFGMLVGAVIAVQFPLLELFEEVNWQTLSIALPGAAALVLLLIVISSLYPSWLASRRTPADALRYE